MIYGGVSMSIWRVVRRSIEPLLAAGCVDGIVGRHFADNSCNRAGGAAAAKSALKHSHSLARTHGTYRIRPHSCES